MGFDQALLYDRVTIFLLLLLSLSVHKCARAWTAWRWATIRPAIWVASR